MHSSRMRTARSSSHRGGVSTSTPWSRHTSPKQAPPRPDPPQLPPWLWAWTRSPSISPLGVGLDQIPPPLPPWVWAWRTPWPPGRPAARHTGIPPAMHAGIAPPWRPAARHAGIPPAMHAGIAPPCGQTHICKHFTLPQTSFAGGNKERCIIE